jgi:hypothetical protein
LPKRKAAFVSEGRLEFKTPDFRVVRLVPGSTQLPLQVSFRLPPRPVKFGPHFAGLLSLAREIALVFQRAAYFTGQHISI